MWRNDLNNEDKRCMKVMTWNGVDGLTKILDQDLFLMFLKCFIYFFGFYAFMIFLDFDVLGWKYIQGNMYKESVFQTLRNAKHTNKPTRLSTRIYKDQLVGVLDIRKVREAQICRWKKILPHSRGETVTQISSFTSQRYKVLWGLAKSDNIPLSREVSFDSAPNFYTLLEHWSWGHPKGWWNPQASLLSK